MKQHKSSRI